VKRRWALEGADSQVSQIGAKAFSRPTRLTRRAVIATLCIVHCHLHLYDVAGTLFYRNEAVYPFRLQEYFVCTRTSTVARSLFISPQAAPRLVSKHSPSLSPILPFATNVNRHLRICNFARLLETPCSLLSLEPQAALKNAPWLLNGDLKADWARSLPSSHAELHVRRC
jgi:hypothetical protein